MATTNAQTMDSEQDHAPSKGESHTRATSFAAWRETKLSPLDV